MSRHPYVATPVTIQPIVQPAVAPPSAPPPGVLLGHYLRVLRERWQVPLLGALVGLLLVEGYLWARPPISTATATVQIEIISSDPFGRDRAASTLVDASTEKQLAGSYVTAVRASEELGGDPSPSEVRAASEAEVLPEGTIVKLRYSHPDATTARRAADALATGYLAERGEQAERQVEASLDAIDARMAELAEIQADALRRIDRATPGTATAATAESDRQLARMEIDSLVSERVALRGVTVRGGSVLTPASEAAVERDPEPTLMIVSGLAGGFLLGLMAAFALSHLSRRVAGPEDLRDLVDAPVWTADPVTTSVVHEGGHDEGYDGGHDRGQQDGHVGEDRADRQEEPAGESRSEHRSAQSVGSWRTAGELFVAASANLIRIAVISDLPAAPTGHIVESLKESARQSGRLPHQFVIVSAEGDRADRLAAARQSEAVLLIVDRGTSRRPQLAALRDDLVEVRRPVLGALFLRWRP